MTSEAKPHTVSESMQKSLSSLRDPWGLYVDPTYFAQPGSVYSTALVDDALEGELTEKVTVGARALCDREEEAGSVGEPWFSWSVARVTRGPAACITTTAPVEEQDPDAAIPQLYAWVDAALIVGTPSRQEVADTVQQRLAGMELATVTDPYVMWRLDQIEALLGLDSTAVERTTPDPVPLSGPDTLTAWWGYTMRCAEDDALCTAEDQPTDEDVATAGLTFPDDLSMAGALAILRSRHADAVYQDLRKSLEARIDSQGLVRLARFVGTVDATYDVLRLDPAMFPGPEPALTTVELRRRLDVIPTSDRGQRLKALAVLKAVDPSAWEKYRDEVDSAVGDLQGRTTLEETVLRDIEAVTALSQMGESVSTRLDIFAVEDDEARFLALAAVAESWVFSNTDEVLQRYKRYVDDAKEVATAPAEPVSVYMMSLRALTGSGVPLTPEQRDQVSTALDDALLGCSLDGVANQDFYRFTLEDDSPCSLQITLSAATSSFGVY